MDSKSWAKDILDYCEEFEREWLMHCIECRKWDLCGIPCCHDIAAISRQQRSPITYVNEVHKRETYDRAYSNYISPMPSQQLWRKSGYWPIKPPLYHKQSGRPKKARTRPIDEIPKGATKLRRYVIVIHCSVCGGEGHNATNCGRADGNMGRGRGRGKGRGTSSVHQSEEEQAIRGGLTRTAATRSQMAPTNIVTQSSGTNAASQPAPCNLAYKQVQAISIKTLPGHKGKGSNPLQKGQGHGVYEYFALAYAKGFGPNFKLHPEIVQSTFNLKMYIEPNPNATALVKPKQGHYIQPNQLTYIEPNQNLTYFNQMKS
ncbi:unnamed protein product [Prunus armeniaca]